MSKRVHTTLVTFSTARESRQEGDLAVEVYPVRHLIHGNKVNPLSFRYLKAIAHADVVHVHHIHTVVSDLACLGAAALRKPAFVTDYGGGGSVTLNRRIPLLRLYRGALAYSQFGLDRLPDPLRGRAVLAKGGIDTDRFRPSSERPREKTILFVGRLLPHKGVNYLIEGFRLLARSDYTLRILGRVYDAEFYEYLKRQAEGLNVDFVHDADDARLLSEYQRARVTVLPSVHRTYRGDYSDIPELMGFTLLESQACETPVICTDAGAMHEFIDDGKTGAVVAQNSGEALAAALSRVIDAGDLEFAEIQGRCRRFVQTLTWSRVVDDVLRTYEGALR